MDFKIVESIWIIADSGIALGYIENMAMDTKIIAGYCIVL